MCWRIACISHKELRSTLYVVHNGSWLKSASEVMKSMKKPFGLCKYRYHIYRVVPGNRELYLIMLKFLFRSQWEYSAQEGKQRWNPAINYSWVRCNNQVFILPKEYIYYPLKFIILHYFCSIFSTFLVKEQSSVTKHLF